MKFISVFTLAFIFSISSAHAIKRVPVKMAITVDDIPGYGDLPHGVSRSEVMNEVLAVFKKHEVPGVYGFINGLKVSEPGAESDSMMQDMKTWVEANYPVGNHTYSHIHLNDLSVKKYTNDNTSSNINNVPMERSDNVWMVQIFGHLVLQQA